MAYKAQKPYKVGLVPQFFYRVLLRKGYTSLTAFAQDYDLDSERLRRYVTGEVKFDLHYFMAVIEALNIPVKEFYGLIYQQDKQKGRM